MTSHRGCIFTGVVAWLVVSLAAAPLFAQDPPAPRPPPDTEKVEEVEETHERPRQTRRPEGASPVVVREPGISPARYVIGGLVGTFQGFGLGHAIVGEYATTGWMYTVGELMTAGMIFAGVKRGWIDKRRASEVDQAMIFGGMAAFSIVRLFEIADLWSRPRVAALERDADDTAFALTPSIGEESGGVLLHFAW